MQETHLDEICDICGDVGFDFALATCTKCYSKEHGYCMQVCCLDIPADWICESCFPSGMVLPEAGGKEVTERTLSIDSSNIACHDKICTAATGGSSSGTAKGKGKGRGKGAGKKSAEAVSESSSSEQTTRVTPKTLPPPLPIVHEIDESASFEPWVPTLLFGDGPISVHDTVLDETEPDLSAHVAHGLARAACLPGDMNQWDSMNSGQIFWHTTRGLMMATQGVLARVSSVLKITDDLQKKSADYKRLEDQHFININLMKGAEDRARAEAESRKKAEVELTELREKVRKVESECLATLGKAREEGLVYNTMEEARTQFRMFYNTGFRQGWKSALTISEQPETSELFLRSNTPNPYPEEGRWNSEDEAEEEGEEEEEDEEEGGGAPGNVTEGSQPAPTEGAEDAPGSSA